ncbi:MAG: signal peptide peptidase SppA, partial [Gemmataceae bacterium]|nr:signal peptide peptidase SppA [Gemmataceae bacterium]
MVRRLFAVAVLTAFVSSTAFAADSPKKGKPAGPVIAHIKMSGDLDEAPGAPDPLFGGAGGDSLRTRIERIHKAAKDDSVKALFLEFGGISAGFGKVDELRQALTAFKATGKKVFCYAESYAAKDYLVAASCDLIGLPESGGVDIHGMRAEITFYKDMFEKVNVKADFLQMGDFKGAAEPYMRSSMSPEFRKQYESVIDDFFEKSYVGAIVAARPEKNRTPESVKKMIDHGEFTAKKAVAAGLVDRLAYYDDFVNLIKAEVKGADGLKVAKNWGVTKPEDVDMSNPFAILKLLNPPKPKVSKEPKIAVVYAVGAIESGKGGGNPLMGGSTIGSTSMVEAIKEAEKDETVKATVLRVDSPGGSALASDLIWNALVSCKKPVIASMGDVAASGGYYISMGCQKVYAEPGTLTGSIGVVGGKIVTGGLMNMAGLKTDIISRGANSGIMSTERAWTESERKVIRESMEDVYDMFLDKTLAGRKRAGVTMSKEKLLTLAGGRVWTGRQALAAGLVDELGTLDDAIAAAKKMAGVEGKEMEILTL